MKYYIVIDDLKNKIMKVQEENLVAFKKEFGDKVLLEGDSVQNLLVKLSENLKTEGTEIPASIFH